MTIQVSTKHRHYVQLIAITKFNEYYPNSIELFLIFYQPNSPLRKLLLLLFKIQR